MFLFRYAWVLVAAGLIVGCADDAPDQVLLLAAASTSEAADELAHLFEAETGIPVRVTTGGSNALANQILAGVPGDVYLSAHPRWAEAIRRAGLTLEMRTLLSNQLVIVAPHGNPAGIEGPHDLLRAERVALASEKVPAGIYAEQALRNAEVHLETGHVVRGGSVRLTLGYVETGEAEAGLVYATDARASGRVKVVYTFSAGAHEAIVYPLVHLRSAGEDVDGRQFYEFLFTPRARAVFEQHGFVRAEDSA